MKRVTPWSHYLLGLIAAVFVLQTVVPGLTELFWLDPKNLAAKPWGLLTSIFLHGSITHLFFNGFALLMFGPLLESQLGSKKFFSLFLAAGLGGSLLYFAFYALGLSAGVPALGASGAVYGVLGALAILAPNIVVLVFFIPMPIRQAALVWVAIEFLGTFNPASGIASAAHFGGLIVGFAAAKFLSGTAQIKIFT